VSFALNSAMPLAIASPMPLDAPVMMATFWDRLNFSFIIFEGLIVVDYRIA